MRFLNIIKKWVVDSQIYVAVMGTLLALFFMYEQNAFRIPTLSFVFLTFFSGYLYTKYQNSSKFFFRVIIINIICAILCAVLIIQNHNTYRLFRWVVIVVLGLFYNSVFLKFYIRKIPLLKVFYVGLTWALIHSWLIIPEFNAGIFWVDLFFVTALVLPFDIRDMRDDVTITFPQLIGTQKTKILAYVLIFISLIISGYCLKPLFSLAYFLTACVSLLLIYFSKQSRSEYYFSVLVESCSGLPIAFYQLVETFYGQV